MPKDFVLKLPVAKPGSTPTLAGDDQKVRWLRWRVSVRAHMNQEVAITPSFEAKIADIDYCWPPILRVAGGGAGGAHVAATSTVPNGRAACVKCYECWSGIAVVRAAVGDKNAMTFDVLRCDQSLRDHCANFGIGHSGKLARRMMQQLQQRLRHNMHVHINKDIFVSTAVSEHVKNKSRVCTQVASLGPTPAAAATASHHERLSAIAKRTTQLTSLPALCAISFEVRNL